MDRREEEKRIAELEATVAELKRVNMNLKARIEEYRTKEQSISNAIIASMEHANQLEASRKKLYTLDIQRSRLMYLRMEQIINELYVRYPELKKDMKLKDMSEKFRSMVYNDLNEKKDSVSFDVKKQAVVDDPIKKLLHNIIDCFDSKKVEAETKNDYVAESVYIEPSSSGFDFNEAMHPTMELEEILKVFNLGKKEDKK